MSNGLYKVHRTVLVRATLRRHAAVRIATVEPLHPSRWVHYALFSHAVGHPSIFPSSLVEVDYPPRIIMLLLHSRLSSTVVETYFSLATS